MSELKGVCIGAGYFSQFHFDAWSRIPEVTISAVCDINLEAAKSAQESYGYPACYKDAEEMLASEKPDFVDVITPPPTHLKLCRTTADLGVDIVCQKPLAPSYDEARELVEYAERKGVRMMVHDNWRFQPWYREIKSLLDRGVVGTRLHSIHSRCRMGDGWGEDAYLGRQPYFRDYPRLFIYETGVHFFDTFRYLAGEITSVYSVLRRLNPVIKGEDCVFVICEFEKSGIGILDANRYNENQSLNPRYTFGELLLEANGGSIRLYTDGELTIQKLGEMETRHPYTHEDRGFAGDSCYGALRHFADRLLDGAEFETPGRDYLKTLRVQEAAYQSAEERRLIELN